MLTGEVVLVKVPAPVLRLELELELEVVLEVELELELELELVLAVVVPAPRLRPGEGLEAWLAAVPRPGLVAKLKLLPPVGVPDRHAGSQPSPSG